MPRSINHRRPKTQKFLILAHSITPSLHHSVPFDHDRDHDLLPSTLH